MTNPASTRPVVFVGSSIEGLPIARALQQNLDHEAEVILWSQRVFGLSEGGLESLVDRLNQFDFAILVLTPDDLITSRENDAQSPRDNVVFELGLFMGSLGRSRTFIVYDRTANLKLPSDLAGVNPATYAPPSAGSLQSALGACSAEILNAIQTKGRRERPDDVNGSHIDQATQFKVVAGLLEPAAWQFFILMREAGATLRREEWVSLGVRFEYAIQSEVQHGTGNGYFGTNKLCQRLADADLLSADLRGRVSLTERGRAFAEWLGESGYRAQYFWSDVGTWGERPPEVMGETQHPRDMPRQPLMEASHAVPSDTSTSDPPTDPGE